MKQKWRCLLMALCWPVMAVAQEKQHTREQPRDTTGSPRKLREVNITGNNRTKSEAAALKKSVVPVTILSGKEIENRASNLNEMLARQAGVQIRQTGGLGSEARISIRGLEGKRVQIFIEGNPLNTPDGSLSINDIPLQLIERIEIYKGTVPAWLGGDGLGGAVNIVIKHRDISYLDASVTRESNHTTILSLLGKKTFERAGMELGAGLFYTATENDYTMESPYQPGLRIKRDHDAYQSLMAGTSLRFHKLWFDEIELEGVYLRNDKQIQGIQRNIQQAKNSADSRILALNARKEGLWHGRLDVRYSLILGSFTTHLTDTSSWMYNWDGSRYPSILGKGEIGTGPNLSSNRQQELRHRLNLNYKLATAWSLNLNNTIRKAGFNPDDSLGNAYAGKNMYNYPGDLFNSVTGLALEGAVLEGKLLMSASLKHYYYQVSGYNTNIYVIGEPDKVSNVQQDVGYNLGIRYNFTPALLVKASYEKALRMPQPTELFGDGALITPAITLHPELAHNVTAGIFYDGKLSDQRRLQLESNVFYMDVSNLIQLAGNGLSLGYVNYQQARIKGVDAEVKYDISRDFYVSGNATWQRLTDAMRYLPGSNHVANPTYQLQLPNIPSFFTNWSVEYHHDGWPFSHSRTRVIYEGSYVHQYDYGFAVSSYENLRIPGYHTHNLAWEQSFRRNRYTITAEVHNLADAIVINNYNNPLPGRTWRLRFRYLLFGKNQ
ncbi:TonB-dependent receptor plug domain-containing protein [Chitinophaga arvensicola]|uniref:Outer membrane cobalamin receptor protein n=1 Tax=Chitinophaga arvensicola TaxID=29529 RepID=A0A1I0S9E0_9BACT|nr:TonB-dependent receptor [Chitinophaga arvensicola]SEW52789.1 Outer membrane cobalamin receptor protein [Chitinophaga arvensicola]